MRLWSLHPCYLDTKGLVALWREGLLAKKVLEGKTKGYKNHPQLHRFYEDDHPRQRILDYLLGVYEEAATRGYHFNKDKIAGIFTASKISVTEGQLLFEKKHLLSKLQQRDIERHNFLSQQRKILPHPMFYGVEGELEVWEKINEETK